MKISLHLFTIIFFLCSNLFNSIQAQNSPETSLIFTKEPIKIIAHTDSSLFLLGKKENSNGVIDLYVSKHTIGKKSIKFDTCLNFNKLFDGNFNPDAFKYKTFQCDDRIVFLFDIIITQKKTLIAKWIDFNGKMSDAIVIDKTDITDKNLNNCQYNLNLTINNDILVTLRRRYNSGYERDKCILLDETLEKIWEYDLPKINCKREVNIITDIDNHSNLVYFIANENNIMMERDINNRDTVIHRKIGYLNYKLKVRKDSLEIIFVNPLQSIVNSKKIYYPFLDFPRIKTISSSQIILYNQVDIDDENFVLPSKIGIYFAKIDINKNKTFKDTLFVFEDKIQQSLSYSLINKINRPTNKEFMLSSEEIIDGNLYSVFEHLNNIVGDLELFISCFNVNENKIQWVNFIPRKVIFPMNESSYLSCFTSAYSNNTYHISFYERKENYFVTKNDYRFNKFEMVKKGDNSDFITYDVSIDGILSKRISHAYDLDHMFPWIKYNEPKRFFNGRAFLPIEFLYKNE